MAIDGVLLSLSTDSGFHWNPLQAETCFSGSMGWRGVPYQHLGTARPAPVHWDNGCQWLGAPTLNHQGRNGARLSLSFGPKPLKCGGVDPVSPLSRLLSSTSTTTATIQSRTNDIQRRGSIHKRYKPTYETRSSSRKRCGCKRLAMYAPAPPRNKKTDITRSRSGCARCRQKRRKVTLRKNHSSA